jgi:hypothetical protein
MHCIKYLICSSCKPGYFNIDSENDFGCTPCFCYGHSSVCRSAPGYSKVEIESIFARGNERWSAQDYRGNSVSTQYNGITQVIGVLAPGREPVYFVAPGNDYWASTAVPWPCHLYSQVERFVVHFINTFRLRGVYILRGLWSHQSGRSIYTPQFS